MMVSNVISNVGEIDGFNIITPEEQSLVKDHISDFLSHKPKQLSPARLKETAQPKNQPKSQNFRHKGLPIPSIKLLFTNADQLTSPKMAELKKVILIENPLLVAIREVKLKDSRQLTTP